MDSGILDGRTLSLIFLCTRRADRGRPNTGYGFWTGWYRFRLVLTAEGHGQRMDVARLS